MRFWLNFPLRDQAGDGDGGGGGNSGSGAPAGGALTLEAIEALFDKKLNGYDKGLQKKLSKLGQPATAKDDGDGDGDDAPPAPKPNSSGVDPEVTRLKKQLDQTNKRLADAEAERAAEKANVKAEKKDAALRRELAKSSFIDDEAFETAYARLDSQIKYTDDGQLVGGEDEQPIGKFVTERMKKLDYLVKPRDVGGAGAANGGKPSPGAEVDIDSIKPGMKPEEKAKVYAQIAATRKQQ